MRVTWTIGAIAGLGCLIALGCGSSDSSEAYGFQGLNTIGALS